MLAKGLGAFNAGLTALVGAHEKKAKDERLAQMDAEWNRWLASTTNDEQLQALWSGKAPYQSDPIFKKVVSSYFGGVQARTLARELDAEFENGAIPLGSTNFNPERFLLERAEPYVQKFARDRDAVESFRKGLDAIRSRTIEKHEQARAFGVHSLANQIVTDSFRDILDQAAQSGLDGATTLGTLRQVIRETGPRLQGGSLGIKYSQGEAALLNVLEQYAADPRYAQTIRGVLTAEREDLTGSGVKLGSFYNDAKHGDRARNILARVGAAEAKHIETTVKGEFERKVAAAFERGDGSFGMASEVNLNVPNPADSTKAITASGSEVAKGVQQKWIQWANENGVRLPDQIAKFAANGLAHPMVQAQLQSAYVAATMTVQSGKPLDATALAQFKQAGDLYKESLRIAPSAPLKLSKEQEHMYETYRILTDVAGQNPDAAAMAIMTAYADPVRKQKPELVYQQRDKIARDLSSEDFNEFYKLGGSALNVGALRPVVAELASALMQTGMMAEKDAVKAALDTVKAKSVFINGQVIYGVPGFDQKDGDIIKGELKKVYDKFSGGLKLMGVNSADDLSVIPVGSSGKFVVAHKTGIPIVVPGNVYDAARPDENPDANLFSRGTTGVEFNLKAVKQLRMKVEAEEKAKAIDDAIKGRGSSWLPDITNDNIPDGKYGGITVRKKDVTDWFDKAGKTQKQVTDKLRSKESLSDRMNKGNLFDRRKQ